MIKTLKTIQYMIKFLFDRHINNLKTCILKMQNGLTLNFSHGRISYYQFSI